MNTCSLCWRDAIKRCVKKPRVKVRPFSHGKANHQVQVKPKKIKISERESKVSLEYIAERDNYICWLCKRRVDPTLRFPDRGAASRDHVYPKSRGGSDTESNIRLAHLGCNLDKGRKVMET